MKTNEAASYLGISEDTLRKWVRNEGLPAGVIGRIWIFKKSTIDAWIDNRIHSVKVKEEKKTMNKDIKLKKDDM